MTKYLPDTNILIKAAKGYSPESEFLNKIIKQRQIMISCIVAAEFLVKADFVEQKTFEALLSEFVILNIDIEVAKIAAEYRKLSFKSVRVQLLDCFIAAQAKLNNLTLVTNNEEDFPMGDIKIVSP